MSTLELGLCIIGAASVITLGLMTVAKSLNVIADVLGAFAPPAGAQMEDNKLFQKKLEKETHS